MKSFVQSVATGLVIFCWAQGTAHAQHDQPVHRVHCGGEAFLGSGARFWDADRGFDGGSLFAVTDTILETADQDLYRTERWNDPLQGVLRYAFPVPPGKYQVRLHFAEIWDGAFGEGKRVFDVNVNGGAVAQALDIYARVGARKPFILEAQADAQEGKIAVEFANQVNHAKISGIEVLPLTPTRSMKAPYRIRCGGEDFVDDQGIWWEADGHFAGGSVYAHSGLVSGTANPLLYRTERFNDPTQGGNLVYEFTVDEGSYTVKLHFAEIFFAEPGQRVFGVDINGKPVETALDVVAIAGARTALVKEYAAAPLDGKIRIEFRNQVENAKVSGIEVLFGEPVGLKSPGPKAGGRKAASGKAGLWRAGRQDGQVRDLKGRAQ